MDENLREILLSVMKDDSIEISPESILSADLGISSFDLLQVVYGVEMDYSISIPADVSKKIVTVQDLMDCISQLVKV